MLPEVAHVGPSLGLWGRVGAPAWVCGEGWGAPARVCGGYVPLGGFFNFNLIILSCRECSYVAHHLKLNQGLLSSWFLQPSETQEPGTTGWTGFKWFTGEQYHHGAHGQGKSEEGGGRREEGMGHR